MIKFNEEWIFLKIFMIDKNNKIVIKNKEIAEEIIGEKKEFPKYVSPLLNLANKFAHGTRPEVVGQMTELIEECPDKSYEGWVNWYKNKYSRNLEDASEKISQMIEEFKKVLDSIDKEIIIKWVEDLTLDKTYIGLKLQKVIIKKVADFLKKQYRFSNPEEEAKGIDGFIGEMAVSVKPLTYKTKEELIEEIEARIIYYDKKKSEVEIDVTNFLKQ